MADATASFIHPTAVISTWTQPAKSNSLKRLNPLFKNAKTGRYMKLDEAVELGLIYAERNLYLLPSSRGNTIEELDLLEAMERI